MISPDAQEIIDRIAAHSRSARGVVDRRAVEAALTKHLAALGLPPQPFRWFASAKDGYAAAESAAAGAARGAAWGATWGAATDAAWSAATDAAWGAAESNALSAFSCPEQARLVAIWAPMVDAFTAGLWLYWITPTEIICIEQPSLHIRDGRLHREDGPAVEWPAGEAYYFWRGTYVPQEWITDRKVLTPQAALMWPNIEQRRAACEILGWETILTQLDARVISADADPEVGTLVEVDIQDVGRERFLRVQCGTGRHFALPVPPHVKTAVDAQAWTWGIDVETFTKPEIRT